MSENTSAQISQEIDQLLELAQTDTPSDRNHSLNTEGLLPLVSLLAQADFTEEIRPPMALKQAWEQQARKNNSVKTWRLSGIKIPVRAMIVSALSILLLVIVAVGPSHVLAAIQHLIGYIPGIGFVQSEDTILVLKEPVNVTQLGISITVVNAVSDSQSTRINLLVDGFLPPASFRVVEGIQKKDGIAFHLSNGEELALKGYKLSFGPTYQIQFDFEKLPAGAKEAVLRFTSIPGMPEGTAPKNWQFLLSFKPGQMERQIIAGTPVMLESNQVNGVSMKLLNIAQDDQKTAFQVQVISVNRQVYFENWENQLVLKDTLGHIIPFFSEQNASAEDRNTVTFTSPSLEPGQEVVLALEGPIQLFEKAAGPTEVAGFTFDPGPNAEIGQTWDLDETLHVAGRTIKVNGARLIKGLEGDPELQFTITPQTDVVGAMFVVTDDHPELVGTGNLSLMFNEIPRTPIRLRVHGIYYEVDGTWEIKWKNP